MERLARSLGCHQIKSTQDLGVDPDWVEAITFAWLAYRYDQQLSSNLPAVTGASKKTVLGALYLP